MDRTLETLQFKIEDREFKNKFVELAQKLESLDLVCKLEALPAGHYIMIRKFPPRKQRRWLSTSWMPRILFAVVISFVMIDGYFRTIEYNSYNIGSVGDPYEMAVIYTFALIGILGIHEAGHIAAARYHKLKTSWPYFIPGIPVFGFLPTFGAFIQSRGLTINREILFDVAIAGPIAGLIVAIVVAMFAAYYAPLVPLEEIANQGLVSGAWQFGEPLLMTAALLAFEKNVEGHTIIMTPLLFASWVGFLITFINLLPAWQLDGGHMARTLIGEKMHRYATFASIGILVYPLGYWPMAMLLLVMSARSPSAQPLDDISPLPTNRKLMYIGIIILAVLCAPLPQTILP